MSKAKFNKGDKVICIKDYAYGESSNTMFHIGDVVTILSVTPHNSFENGYQVVLVEKVSPSPYIYGWDLSFFIPYSKIAEALYA